MDGAVLLVRVRYLISELEDGTKWVSGESAVVLGAE